MSNALDAAGPQAAWISQLWWLTLWLCVVVFVAVMAALARRKNNSSDFVLRLRCMPIKYHADCCPGAMRSQVPALLPIDWKPVQPNRLADVPQVQQFSVWKIKGFLSMKLRFLAVCLGFALMNLPAFAQENPSPVNAPLGARPELGRATLVCM